MNNKIVLESLALDLKRVALGYHRESYKMGERFYHEACKRTDEVDFSLLKPYLKDVLKKVQTLQGKDAKGIAEEAQMLSTLIQNYSIKYLG